MLRHPLALTRELDELFELMRRPFSVARENDTTIERIAALNIEESEQEYRLRLLVPGIAQKDIELTLDGNVLRIQATAEKEKEEDRPNTVYREYVAASYVRSIRLPENADLEKITADCRDGVLTVTVSKKASALPKKIAIHLN